MYFVADLMHIASRIEMVHWDQQQIIQFFLDIPIEPDLNQIKVTMWQQIERNSFWRKKKFMVASQTEPTGFSSFVQLKYELEETLWEDKNLFIPMFYTYKKQ